MRTLVRIAVVLVLLSLLGCPPKPPEVPIIVPPGAPEPPVVPPGHKVIKPGE